ncbi:host specificity factor TipJ family phage tail protein [uncultured Psychrobacter sp.]|uniref:host specificity factor TipJ family phage tail protein n=1 Tax=uncultured Psychrobacter sp. TaxID=259303 RepID=UPI0026110C21|nr:host specificity factor TipJ family phage tail protein [uncultured Psychrobacter sp.]
MLTTLKNTIRRLMAPKAVELVIINDWFDYIADSGINKTLHGTSVYELLRKVYPDGLPTNTVFYKDSLSAENIIPDSNAAEVAHLYQQTGRIYAVTYPADPLTIAIVVGIGAAVAVTMLMPKPEIPNSAGSTQPPSPNNSLAQRGNRQRIGGRPADAYGENWMYPDLAAVTYSVYDNHDEIEFSTMALGMGKYHVTRARDDTTDFARIRGATAEFYEPGQNVRADTPATQFGNSLTTNQRQYAYLVAKRYDAVNGQVLPPPDNYLILSQISFSGPNVIDSGSSGVNLTSHFRVGQTISIEQATDLASGNNLTITTEEGSPEIPVTYNLNGDYIIESIIANQINLQSPALVNADWQKLTDNIDFTKPVEITMSTESQTLWSDYFYTSGNDHTDVLYNIVAPQGLYLTTVDKWHALSVAFQVESQVVDTQGNPISGTLHVKREVIKAPKFDNYLSPNHVNSDNDVRRTAAVTYRVSNPYQKKGENIRVRYRRMTRRVTHTEWSAQQEIRIADLIGIRNLSAGDYDNDATMVVTMQQATAGALSFKERKFNCLAFRYVRNWRDNDALILSKRIDDISYHIGTDPDVGDMTIHDFDMPQISAEVDRAANYFGTEQCVEFCYTFDKNTITPSEILATVANAGFCKVYDFSNKIRFYFESATDVPVANFTAHNILPGSFQPAQSFGRREDKDGVVAKWRDPVDDAQMSLHIPPDESAINPDEVELIGVRNKTQAYMHARRRDQKNKYARQTVQFVGHDESNIVIESNCVAVADQFRADTQQGEARRLEKVGTDILLTTSEPVIVPDGGTATIWLQTTAGYVDNIAVTGGPRLNQLILARMPSSPISTDPNAVVRATYQVAINDTAKKAAYIVTDKAAAEFVSNQVTAVNYDDRYYLYDNEYIVNQLTWLTN